MKESIESVVNWHCEAFPEATLEGQINKFNEEWDEYFEAKTKAGKLKELADVFIVAFALNRFDLQEGLFYINDAWQLYAESPFGWEDLERAINEKMAKNRQRIWKQVKPGEYHHE